MDNHATRPEVEQALATGEGVAEHMSATLHRPFIYAAVTFLRDGAVVGIVRVSGRRSATAARWQSGVADAYAESAVLYDAMRAAETPTALAAEDAGARWFDIQRRADDLIRTLYALREAAPDEDQRARVSDVLASAQGARSAMDAERAPGGANGQNVQVVRGRLLSFEASIRALRAPDEPGF